MDRDQLLAVLQLSRDDLLKALPEAERQLEIHRTAAEELETRIRLVRQLLNVSEPAVQPPASTVRGLKYDALERWLRQQPRRPMSVRFDRIEEILGRPLPPSSRRYAAHWHSREGSSVARAIKRANWAVRDLNLRDERLTFVPVPEFQRAHGLPDPA